MAKTPKDCIRVSYTLERKVAESLAAFCEETGRTKTKVVELAIQEYIKNHREEK